MSSFPLGTPVLDLVTVTQDPTATQNKDTSLVTATSGRHGETLVSEIHGARYVKASRGNLFWGTSGVAGASLLAPGGTTAGFVLYNPVGSGVIVEVEQFKIVGASTETDVIAGLALEGSVQTPSGTLTGATIANMPLGGPTKSPMAKVYKACTIAAMTFLGGIGLTVTATTSPMPVGLIDFDGTLLLWPGYSINFCSTITQSSDIAVCDVIWSEWLP
jgi:hypothetical protein